VDAEPSNTVGQVKGIVVSVGLVGGRTISGGGRCCDIQWLVEKYEGKEKYFNDEGTFMDTHYDIGECFRLKTGSMTATLHYVQGCH